MKNLLDKYKKIYNALKYENIIFHQMEKKPTKKEKYFSFFVLFLVFIYFFIMNLINNFFDNLYIISLLFITNVALFINIKRELSNIRKYYNERKKLFTNYSPQEKRLIFMYTFFKLIKPAIQACFACAMAVGSVGLGINQYYKEMLPNNRPPLARLGDIINYYTGVSSD